MEKKQAANSTGEKKSWKNPQKFSVAGWDADPETLRLIQGSAKIKLEPKVMNVLIYLAHNPGVVVTREALEASVWKGRVVGYDAVANTIIKLRKAFGDDSRNPRIIETIPKSGYRLIAPVHWMGEESVPNIPANTEISGINNGNRNHRRVVQVSVGLLILVVLGFSLQSHMNRLDSPVLPKLDNIDTLGGKPSIAVLPFNNIGGSPEQEYFANGITEDLITDLSKVSGLLVVARNSVFAYKGSQEREFKIGRELGATYLLKGSLQKDHARIRINVHLLDTNSGNTLWAERYDRELTDLFKLQDELTAQIVSALEVKLAPSDRKRLARNYETSVAAYEEYLRGLDHWGRRSFEENEVAKRHFERAIELDPNFARAYAGLALAYSWGVLDGWDNQSNESLKTASEMAERAIQLDASNPQGYFVRAHAELSKRNYEEAIRQTELAISTKPNFADGYALLGWILHFVGHVGEGMKNIDRAIRLNPRVPSAYYLIRGALYYSQDNLDDALAEYEAGWLVSPTYHQLQVWLAAGYAATGRIDEAQWQTTEILARHPEFSLHHVEQAFPIRDPLYLERFLADLKKAGLPE